MTYLSTAVESSPELEALKLRIPVRSRKAIMIRICIALAGLFILAWS
jgi:hypothetical protein